MDKEIESFTNGAVDDKGRTGHNGQGKEQTEDSRLEEEGEAKEKVAGGDERRQSYSQ